jgi:VWFA-related protein
MISASWLFIAVFIGAISAQQTAAPQPSEIVLHGGTREVLLDFVVRDKHQREVKDIRPEEVEIYEDGARQTLKSFQYRTGKDAQPVTPGSSHNTGQPLKLDPLREINLVTMVFAGMSPLSRQQASAMAHDFLRTEPGPNTWIGVFTLKYKLAAIQPYTADIQLLHKAVDRAATGQYQQFAKENLELIQHINSLQPDTKQYLQPYKQSTLGPDQQLRPNPQQFQPLQPGSAEESVRGSDAAVNASLAAIDRITLRLLFRQEGTRTIDGLRSLIREQAQIPGRKTVLFFSEGLVIPPDQPELLESVISEANRSNLTFYTLDARGLSTVSNSRLSVLTQEAIQTSMSQISDAGPSVMRTDLQANARRLATGTGGFAMDNSNDLRAPLLRLMEDVRSHYEVTYSPVSMNFDGHFRKLALRLARPGVMVQSRAGYYALPMVAGEALAPFEMAALKVLTTQPEPHAFAFHAAALRFGAVAGGHVYRVVISIPSAALRFVEQPAKNSVAIHVSALGLVKDERGQVVRKVSKDLLFEAPADKRAEFQSGDTNLILPLDLPTGVYHLETAVIDRVADRASVRRSVVVVPGARAACQASDFVWVRRVQPSSDRDLFNPLDTAVGTITPAFDPVFAKSDAAHFYFVVYPAPGASDKPISEMIISKDGKTIAAVRLDLPEANPDGSYPFLESLPTATLAPGQYDVQVKTSQEGQTSLLASQFLVQ